ncbi:MAG: class I SAM-dependent methyltransferase [Nitrososphaeraceae archaeon]|nr:class I SAM-dependent methyltransferase [Nitrososphaeraceae archaeon]
MKVFLDVLSEIEEVAKKNSLPTIGPIKGKIIEKVIKQYKPKRLLEIGSLHGYSAILMANYVLKINHDYFYSGDADEKGSDTKKVIVTCLEIDKQLANITRKNIEKAGLSDRIKVITGDALKIIPMLDKTQKFDFVFLDAEKNQYFLYLKLLEENNLLDKKVTIVADNVLLYENEMKDYLDYVRNSGRYNSITTETSLEFNKNIDDALEISRTTTFG